MDGQFKIIDMALEVRNVMNAVSVQFQDALTFVYNKYEITDEHTKKAIKELAWPFIQAKGSQNDDQGMET